MAAVKMNGKEGIRDWKGTFACRYRISQDIIVNIEGDASAMQNIVEEKKLPSWLQESAIANASNVPEVASASDAVMGNASERHATAKAEKAAVDIVRCPCIATHLAGGSFIAA